MGLRGPKPGSVRQKLSADGAENIADLDDNAQDGASEFASDASTLPRWQRENPIKLCGEALRQLARQRGIPNSTINRVDEERLRRELLAIERERMDAEALA